VQEVVEFESPVRRRGVIDIGGAVQKNPFLVVGMLSRLAPSLRLPMDKVLRGEDSRFVCRVRMHVKDARFRVVDPDNRVRHDRVPVGAATMKARTIHFVISTSLGTTVRHHDLVCRGVASSRR
jgi:hypothetical protein